jgi:hypothetical protein
LDAYPEQCFRYVRNYALEWTYTYYRAKCTWHIDITYFDPNTVESTG